MHGSDRQGFRSLKHPEVGDLLGIAVVGGVAFYLEVREEISLRNQIERGQNYAFRGAKVSLSLALLSQPWTLLKPVAERHVRLCPR